MRGVEGMASALVFVGLIVGVATTARWRVGRRSRAKRDPARSVQIGTTRGRRGYPVELGLDELQQGVLVGGSPGAGKTTLLAALAARLPEGVGCAFVDLKGDRSLAGKLRVPYDRVFGLGDRCAASWNPLDAGNPASWRDILLAAEEWTEPHYRRAAARFLGAVLAALMRVRPTVTLDEVIRLLEQPKRAVGLVREVEGRERDVLAGAIAAIESEASLRSGVHGLGNRLALLCDSPASAGRFGAAGGIDLRRVLRGERVLFSLPAAEFPDEAPAIAASAIQSFGAVGQRAAVGDETLRAVLVVDEAPRLGGQQLREAVAIGRGAGIGTVVAVQDFADLDYVADGTREAVETGANTWIVMRQVASAEAIANALGSRKVEKETVQRDASRIFFTDTGMRSVREVDEYVISPNVIRGLRRGEAIVWRRLRGRVDRISVDAADTSGGPG